MANIRTIRKSKDDDTPHAQLIRQLDELQRVSQDAQREHYGIGWEQEVKNFYHLADTQGDVPSFRPRVRIPQLQTLILNEATDLSDTTPIVYIAKHSQRDADRETAYQQHWRQGFANNRLLESILTSLLYGIGYLQVGFDAFARRGQGQVYVSSRLPTTVFPDPKAHNEDDWAWVQFTDSMYVDKIRQYWDRGVFVEPTAHSFKSGLGDPSGVFDMLPGPMTSTSGPHFTNRVQGDGQSTVRYTFIYDNTVEEIKKQVGSSFDTRHLEIPAKLRMKYPNGRMIVDCEGIPLFDDNNPYPLNLFPIVRIPALPALYGWYPPPPMRYTKTLQDLSERMYTQIFENMVRTNNAQIFIYEDSGLDPDDFGGIPGEVRVINGNSKPPEYKFGTPYPAQILDFPDKLLALQRELQGFSASRSGDAGAGNTSAGLFDASIYQAQFLTRLRARLLAEPIQRFSELYFYTMVKYYINDRTFPAFSKGIDVSEATWTGTNGESLEDYMIELDPGSLRPVSNAALRSMVKDLRAQGMIDVKHGLEMLDVPEADEIAKGLETEQQLAALANIKRRR